MFLFWIAQCRFCKLSQYDVRFTMSPQGKKSTSNTPYLSKNTKFSVVTEICTIMNIRAPAFKSSNPFLYHFITHNVFSINLTDLMMNFSGFHGFSIKKINHTTYFMVRGFSIVRGISIAHKQTSLSKMTSSIFLGDLDTQRECTKC